MGTAIWWIRRDLRLSDNQALHAALDSAARVLPVFILDPALWNSPYTGEKRRAFLLGGLRALDADLRARGSRLIVRQGRPDEELARLRDETGAEAIFAEADVSPYARRRDARVAAHLPLRLIGGLTVRPPEAVRKQDGGVYTVYTPYSRVWRALPLPDARELLPTPEHIPTPPDVHSLALPDAPVLPEGALFIPGEAEAQRRLQAFVADRIASYATGRDMLALAGTSGLSPYLRFGMLSARQAAVAALTARDDTYAGADIWLSELIWREFYMSVLYHFPNVHRESFREDLRSIAWDNNVDAFAAWQAGRTGYPVVDAAMRQLLATGWMHNRARMIVASFLAKHLLIDWRWGERHFMRHLIDGDPAANNGGWQWSVGTGTDAAPYFRIFNPVLQGEKYDPHGDYVRRWVPELARAPLAHLHHPWTMPADVQRVAGCIIGVDYPAPIVEHAWARQRALRVYKNAKREA
ncbi:MAG TPA: deoxyribodipyrimidine photo-lyase [Anaerolineae bacterium]|nr:deoxyribodipyrimidine photo-lyase [Anaerolineae bacterium]HQI85878.1 deoxyribodipyrimidine photo-lyase [Anaerolineae bacterium]